MLMHDENGNWGFRSRRRGEDAGRAIGATQATVVIQVTAAIPATAAIQATVKEAR